MSLGVRPAVSAGDRHALFRFRYRIYVEEHGLCPREADHTAKVLYDELDDYSVSYWRSGIRMAKWSARCG